MAQLKMEEKPEEGEIDVMENKSSRSEDEDESQKGDESENEANQAENQGIKLNHYGNFKAYYKRRNEGLAEDPRLEILRKEWFEGKKILDIGCNSGKFTISIAQTFSCRSILGIDIDRGLVKKAKKNLRKIAKSKPPGESSNVKDKDHAEQSSVAGSSSNTEEIPRELSSLEQRKNLRDIVSFKEENFIMTKHPQEQIYDTILCLSVTQWIHLNWGDEGLITLFVKIWELLRPGGVLVLEPQLWRSYENRHHLSIVTTDNFKKIKLFPQDFQEILLDKIGFRTVEHINPSWLHSKKDIRINRPVLVFKK